MQQYLQPVLNTVVKALREADLDVPIPQSAEPAEVFQLIRFLNPDHETEKLLAAEVEVAFLLWKKRRDAAYRESLRAKLNSEGAEVNLVS